MTENGKNGNGKASGLTIKQRVWVEEYLRCWNATEAARQAGYKWPRQSGYLNATKDYIKEEIHKRLSAKCMGADEVLMRLAEQARVSIGMFFTTNEDGEIVVDWPVILSGKYGHLIKSISFTRSGPKIEVYDAQHALAHLGKHHGLFTDKLDLTTKGDKIGSISDDQRLAAGVAYLDAIRARSIPADNEPEGAVDTADEGTD